MVAPVSVSETVLTATGQASTIQSTEPTLLGRGLPPWFSNYGTGVRPHFGPSGMWQVPSGSSMPWETSSSSGATITISTSSPSSAANVSTPVSISTAASATSDSSTSNRISGTTTAALGVGSAIILVLLVGACVYAMRFRKRRRHSSPRPAEGLPVHSETTDISTLHDKPELAACLSRGAVAQSKPELAAPLWIGANGRAIFGGELAGNTSYQELAESSRRAREAPRRTVPNHEQPR